MDHICYLVGISFAWDEGKIDILFASAGVEHSYLDQVFILCCIQTLHTERTIEVYPFTLFIIKRRVFNTGVSLPFLMHHQQTLLPAGIPDFKYNALSHL